VGDSMEHDVAGSPAAGIDAPFVCAGIHEQDFSKEELGSLRDVDGNAVARIAAAAGLAAAPALAIGRLRWSLRRALRW
jgi:ribonucleotide monophosphatase NagD (HAD superfamily)